MMIFILICALYVAKNWIFHLFIDESPFTLYYVPNIRNDVVWASQQHSVPQVPQTQFSYGDELLTARGLTKLHIIPQKTSIDSHTTSAKYSKK